MVRVEGADRPLGEPYRFGRSVGEIAPLERGDAVWEAEHAGDLRAQTEVVRARRAVCERRGVRRTRTQDRPTHRESSPPLRARPTPAEASEYHGCI